MHAMVNIALRAARKAGELIERATDRIDQIDIIQKTAHDFVTEIDQAAEKEILYHLQKAYPHHAFLSEEAGLIGSEEAEYRWIIDPLDGTTNFLHEIPHFAISIACMYNGRIEHAVVYNPITHDEFTASRGEGARLNNRRIRVKKAYEKNSALFATGIPFGNCDGQTMQAFNNTLANLATGSAGVRRMGSASLDLAYVAAGRFDAYWEIGIKPWDIAAGILLVQEAGGLVSDYYGAGDMLKNGHIVAASVKSFKPTLQVVHQAHKELLAPNQGD